MLVECTGKRKLIVIGKIAGNRDIAMLMLNRFFFKLIKGCRQLIWI